MDPEALALLSGWLAQRTGALPQTVALDGKMTRDHIGLLTLILHQNKRPWIRMSEDARAILIDLYKMARGVFSIPLYVRVKW